MNIAYIMYPGACYMGAGDGSKMQAEIWIKELERKGVPGRILTTDYLTFSQPKALRKLKELTNIDLRMYCTGGENDGFHTKGYIFQDSDVYRIIIGSSKGADMNIAKNRNGSTLEILLEGRLDTVTSPDLDVVIKDSLDGVTELIFDLDKLEYISSSGLRTLLAAQKIMNKQGTMKIVDANEMVMEIFEVTGFIDILNVETRA